MRHAFLIIAHNNWELLKRLIKKLDDKNHDIYVLIDKKSKVSDETLADIKAVCQYSDLKFVKRYRINWGGYSQINGELRLLESAKKENYDYYHIMSGIDFPIKSLEYIQRFFEEHKGYEFVHFCAEEYEKKFAERNEQYHILQEYVGGRKTGILWWIERALVKIQQKLLMLNRAKRYKDIIFKGGSNWCSITGDAVGYLLKNEEKIKKMYSFSVCCDECFVQTMLYNSPFRSKIFYGNATWDSDIACLRSVDWERGNPYIYQEKDYEELIQSENLFCRKVSDREPQCEALIKKLELL